MPTPILDALAGTKHLTRKQKHDLIVRLLAERPELNDHEIGKLARARADTVHFIRSIEQTKAEWRKRAAGGAS